MVGGPALSPHRGTTARISRRDALIALGIVAAYLGAGQLGASVAEVAGAITAVWAPSGIALAALALFGLRMWPAVAIAVVITEFSLGLPLSAAALLGVGNTLEAVVGLVLMRRIAGFRPTMDRASDVLALAVLGGVVACAIAATGGVLTLWLHGLIEADTLGLAWLVWWAGDTSGVLVVTPALLVLATMRSWRPADPRRAAEVALLATVVAGLIPLVVLMPTAYPFLVMAPLMWAALRFGVAGAALCSLALAGVVVVASGLDAGPFAGGSLTERLVLTAAFVGATGTTSLIIGAIRSERLRASADLEGERSFLAAVLESLDAGVVACDADGTLALFNRATRELHGIPQEPLPASEWADRYALLRPDGSPMVMEDVPLFRALRGEDVRRAEMMVDGADGERRTLLANGRQIIGADGDLLGAVVAMNDVTTLNEARDALRSREAEMRALVERAPIGIFSTTPDGLCRLVNPQWEAMAGLSADQALGSGWTQAVHPEDRRRVAGAWARGTATRAAFRHEFRMRRPDGRVTWVETRAVPVRDEAGTVRGWVGASTDIGERLQQARELEAREHLARAVADEWDQERIFALAAQEAARVVGVQTAAITRFQRGVGVVVGAWAPPGTAGLAVGTRLLPEGTSATAQVARTGRVATIAHSAPAPTVGATDGDDSIRPDGVVAPVRVAGTLWGTVGVAPGDDAMPPEAEQRIQRFADLVGLVVATGDARAQLAELAATDDLTGLANRRAFTERIAAEVERARRHGRALGLVVFDIDHFKVVNDTQGHPMGDRVLVEVGRRLSATAREGELVARVGGEEFAWVLPETDGVGALAAAERLRAAMSAAPFEHVGRLTISLGVADLADATSPDELFRLADQALYWAKGQGRDRACRFTREALALMPIAATKEGLDRARALAGVQALARAIDAKDSSTGRHSVRVADLARTLALASGWDPGDADLLHGAALVHDVGKIGVSDAILLKPGALTPDEYESVKGHAALGASIVEDVLTDRQVSWVRGHHERFDGSGYPDGLSGSGIPAGARLLAMADAWDAMTFARPFGIRLTPTQALAECAQGAGSQFCPEAVAALQAWAGAQGVAA